MEFFDTVKNRHSVRKFQDRKVEDEKLKMILETANSAPSAGNLQAYEIFLVKDKKKKQLLVEAAYGQDFIEEADIVLVFCANPKKSSWKYGKRGRDLYCIQDATIAASYAQLAVSDLKLGSVWVGAFDEKEVLKVLGNPNDVMPIAIIPIGYPDEKPRITSRRKLDDLVHKV